MNKVVLSITVVV